MKEKSFFLQGQVAVRRVHLSCCWPISRWLFLKHCPLYPGIPGTPSTSPGTPGLTPGPWVGPEENPNKRAAVYQSLTCERHYAGQRPAPSTTRGVFILIIHFVGQRGRAPPAQLFRGIQYLSDSRFHTLFSMTDIALFRAGPRNFWRQEIGH